jgi:hypothetical protein
MRTVALILALSLAAAPVVAAAGNDANDNDESQSSSSSSRSAKFWTGIALGVAGVATSVAGVTVARVTDSSTGNAPGSTYQACVAQKANPIYATNDCDGLKAKNRGMLWGGVAVGALGAVLVIGSTQTSAQIAPGAIRIFHTIRF